MLSKSRIRTSKDDRFIQDRKTLVCVNFATRKVAEKNAEKYSKLLCQNVSVLERVYPAGRSFVLVCEKSIF